MIQHFVRPGSGRVGSNNFTLNSACWAALGLNNYGGQPAAITGVRRPAGRLSHLSESLISIEIRREGSQHFRHRSRPLSKLGRRGPRLIKLSGLSPSTFSTGIKFMNFLPTVNGRVSGVRPFEQETFKKY